MNSLQIISIVIIWLLYGLYSISKTKFLPSFAEDDSESMILKILMILFSPVVFCIRAIYGTLLKDYE